MDTWDAPFTGHNAIHSHRNAHRQGSVSQQRCQSCGDFRQQPQQHQLEQQLAQRLSQMNLLACAPPPAFVRYVLKFGALHSKVLPSPLQDIQRVSLEVLTRILSERTPIEVVPKLANVLFRLWQTRGITITGFLSTVIYALENDLCFWPIVQWRESNGVEGMAIFLFEGTHNDKISWMIHRATPQPTEQGNTWQNAKITWRVRDMEAMKSLCYAAMHFDNVLSWTPEQTLNLYCHVKPQRDVSQQEVLKYAEMLYFHLKNLERMEEVFDAVVPQIYASCHQQGLSTSLLCLMTVIESNGKTEYYYCGQWDITEAG